MPRLRPQPSPRIARFPYCTLLKVPISCHPGVWATSRAMVTPSYAGIQSRYVKRSMCAFFVSTVQMGTNPRLVYLSLIGMRHTAMVLLITNCDPGRSSSMSSTDRRPLDNTPTTRLIQTTHNNRLGAVYSSLQGFWQARHQAMTAAGRGGVRRDAYTVILFNNTITTAITHNFMSTPEQLLATVLQHRTERGTNFGAALQAARAAIEDNWSAER